MRQLLHIFRKDARYLWREILLLLALTAIFAIANPWWMAMMMLVSASFLIARLVHAEAIPGDRQFWITRPYRWTSLLGAKLLFVLVFVNLPISVAQLLIVARGGFPVRPCIPGAAWALLLAIVVVALPVAAFATVTRGLGAFIFPTLILATIWFSVTLLGPWVPRKSWPYGVEWVRDMTAILVATAVAAAVLYVQYRKRLTWLGRAIGVSGAGAVAALWWLLPWAPAWALQSHLAAPKADSAQLQIRPDWSAIKFKPVHSRSWDNVLVGLPIRVSGIPDGIDMQTDALTVSFRAEDGRRSEVTVGSATWRSTGMGTAAVEVVVAVNLAFYKAQGEKPVTIRGSVYLTGYGNPRAKTIPLRRGPVNVMDGLQCFLGPFDQLYCQSAFRWPDRLVYANASPVTYQISHSPFPAGVVLDPFVTHMASSMPHSADEVKITLKEPLMHIRRDFELGGVRLPRLYGD